MWALESAIDDEQAFGRSSPALAPLNLRDQRAGIGALQSSINNLQSTISLYCGPFLAGFSIPDSIPFEEWLILKRERLHQQADFYESFGEYEQALIYARRQVELEPWLEEAHRQIMRLLALSEQSSQALAQYESCKRILADELGIEPANETTHLYETIRTGRPGHQPRKLPADD